MIVPMKKYSFLIYHREYINFLKGLQEMGVVHVIEKETGGIEDEDLQNKYRTLNDISNSIKFLERFETGHEKPIRHTDGMEVQKELQALRAEEESAHHQLAQLEKEKSFIEPWGEFSWETINKLNAAGYGVDFYVVPARNFDPGWLESYDIELINDSGSMWNFVLIQKADAEVELDAEKVRLPDRSLSTINTEISKVEEKIADIRDAYLRYAAGTVKVLHDTHAEIKRELDFSNVVLNTEKQAEDRLMILEGWVPEDQAPEIEGYLDQMGVYYESAKADPATDVPPIKLKNNRFARLYESIGELYTFPDYKELDLTPFFAPFYMLFFGFCLGDAGYGLLITLGTIIGMMKAPKKMRPLLKLGMFLGIATTFMGVVGGTFFGIMLHPEEFKNSVQLAPWIQKYQQYIVSGDNLMYAALGLGYVQVLFGMFINAANRARMHGFKYAISQLGWNVIVMITLPAFVLFYIDLGLDLSDRTTQTLKMTALISGIIGAVPALFYNTPGKNPLLNFGVGLWDTYQVASGLLGDILSYIRLFALGLSSAILGNVFNQLAMQSSNGLNGGVAGAIVMIVILLFGHSLNFFMAALGSFVHPLRLTFVEFYKNAGFMGGGRKYQPFSN